MEIANSIGILSRACEASAGYIGTGSPSVHDARRFANATIMIEHTEVPADATILVLLAPAGLPFGSGRHQCPGERIAVTLATEILKRMPKQGNTCRYTPSLNIGFLSSRKLRGPPRGYQFSRIFGISEKSDLLRVQRPALRTMAVAAIVKSISRPRGRVTLR